MIKIWVLAFGAILWASVAAGADAGAAMAGPGLPEAVAKRIKGNPDAFARTAASIILGYGGDEGLTAEGVARLVAVEQARTRARWMGRLLPADLDGDARVTQKELLAVATLGDLSARATLDLAFRAADADDDGVATLAEIHADAAERAGEAGAMDRSRTRAEDILACDRDGDGAARIDEVLETIAEVRGGG